ncbi:MAG TPA: class I SAM-dependent methyltransferase [Kribbellaceae bacterium]|nr:class I SAM-dependent methyltransferase [Kribbellaceae bacterium]
MTSLQPDTAAGDLYARIRASSTATLDLMTIQLGRRLGLYDALADGMPVTAPDLAERTGLNERMVREWLEQQAVTGFVDLADATVAPEQRRYSLPDASRQAFCDADSLSFAAPMADDVLRTTGRIADLEQAFRTGTGLNKPYHWEEGRPDGSRAWFLQLLGTAWFPAVPDLHERLSAQPPARIADIGVGSGWSSIAMAQSYPDVLVDGYDLDELAIGYAQQHARDAGLDDRVRFVAGDATSFDTVGRYDLVTVFEALHDLSYPVAVLSQLRGLLADSGTVLIADERVPDQIVAPGTELDRHHYGWSVLNCLPAVMTEPDSAATGAVMRIGTLRRYAEEAGFDEVEVLPIEHHEWRFYRLRP